ncbi:unnamed protein product [Oreochromis niloticus]|nr:unnamed protein product [Mustela putorius furo]
MEVTPLCIRLVWYSLLLITSEVKNSYFSQNAELDGTYLYIEPNKLQFFEYESITFKCEGFSRGAEWRVMKKTPSMATTRKSSTGILNIMTAYLLDGGEYWCENLKGEKSNTVNITVTDGDVILESPALAVTQHTNVTLRCKEKTASLKRSAHFFKDGQLINTIYEGEMTINSASQSDEGLYKCRISGSGESLESWLAVRGGDVFLEFPGLPVMEGDNVTIHCRRKGTFSKFTANFFKDGDFIETGYKGEMTIQRVMKSHEGFYKCSIAGSRGESEETWLSVRVREELQHEGHAEPHPSSDHSCHIYLMLRTIFTILLMALLVLLVGLFYSKKLGITQQ